MHETLKSSETVFVSHFVTVLAGIGMACLACATWRATDVATRHNTDALATQQRHHQELVESIESLAEKSGMLTSADLCPVRFRIRRPDGITVPMKSPRAILRAKLNDGSDDVVSSCMATSGTMHFGLIPPGQYRLDLQMDDGMCLEHEFDVLPGVPVDRHITCPLKADPACRVSLDLDWPDGSDVEGLFALCSIGPGHWTHGEWTWTYVEPNERYLIVAAPAGMFVTDADCNRLRRTMPQLDPLNWHLSPASEFRVPFRSCQLNQIVFLRETAADVEILGAIVFPTARDAIDFPIACEHTCRIDAPAPSIELKFAWQTWAVPLPEGASARLASWVHEL